MGLCCNPDAVRSQLPAHVIPSLRPVEDLRHVCGVRSDGRVRLYADCALAITLAPRAGSEGEIAEAAPKTPGKAFATPASDQCSRFTGMAPGA